MDKQQKKALKQAARLMERRSLRDALPIPIENLVALLDHLDVRLPQAGCDHSHRLTQAWCATNGIDSDAIIEWARENGGYCDCEILANTEDIIEEAGKA